MESVSSESRLPIAILIDADNVGVSAVSAIFKTVSEFGTPIVRRAYGMVKCFTNPEGWLKAQHEFGIVARPQVSNVTGKNVADIALVIDAMELLYTSICKGFCIVSGDSDFTALALRIRENGKDVYGIGPKTTPESFRTACTKFVQLPVLKQSEKVVPKTVPCCPRCGGHLEDGWTRSRKSCRSCKACGGMLAKIGGLKSVFAAESIADIVEQARKHEQAGCLCPECGASMSIVRVAAGKKSVEIDVCGQCQSVWYDKDEFESLVPTDGLLKPDVSAGKAYRREIVLSLTADIRAGRRPLSTQAALQGLLKSLYHVPRPDLKPIVDTLICQKVIKIDKTGKISKL